MRFMTTNIFVVITTMPFEQRAPKYVSSYLEKISDTCLAFGAKSSMLKLRIIQIRVETTFCKQFFVSAFFYDVAFVHNEN